MRRILPYQLEQSIKSYIQYGTDNDFRGAFMKETRMHSTFCHVLFIKIIAAMGFTAMESSFVASSTTIQGHPKPHSNPWPVKHVPTSSREMFLQEHSGTLSLSNVEVSFIEREVSGDISNSGGCNTSSRVCEGDKACCTGTYLFQIALKFGRGPVRKLGRNAKIKCSFTYASAQ